MYGGRQVNNGIQAMFFRGGTPITFLVLALTIAAFIITLALPASLGAFPLAFSAAYGLRAPWTLFTWPFAHDASGPLGLLFAAGWFYTSSASMERAWGTREYGIFLAVTGLLTALTTWAGSFLVGPAVLAGLWIFASPPTVAWCMANRRETVNLFFLPVPAPFIAVLSIVLVWYYAGASQGNPVLGLFALSGSGAAYWYATQGRYASNRYTTSRSANKPFGGLRVTTGSSSAPRTSDRERVTPTQTPLQNPLAWLRARLRRRREDKQFADILRRSGFSDPDDKN